MEELLRIDTRRLDGKRKGDGLGRAKKRRKFDRLVGWKQWKMILLLYRRDPAIRKMCKKFPAIRETWPTGGLESQKVSQRAKPWSE